MEIDVNGSCMDFCRRDVWGLREDWRLGLLGLRRFCRSGTVAAGGQLLVVVLLLGAKLLRCDTVLKNGS